MELVYLATQSQIVDCSAVALVRIMSLVNSALTVIYIAVPIILIIMGSIDLLKAILQSDDKKMKEAQSLLWKRLLYGALIFFLGIIVQFVIFDIIRPSGITRACWNETQTEVNPNA